jgi:hypothetical protein
MAATKTMSNLIRTLGRALENHLPSCAILSIAKQACILSTLELARDSPEKTKRPNCRPIRTSFLPVNCLFTVV